MSFLIIGLMFWIQIDSGDLWLSKAITTSPSTIPARGHDRDILRETHP